MKYEVQVYENSQNSQNRVISAELSEKIHFIHGNISLGKLKDVQHLKA